MKKNNYSRVCIVYTVYQLFFYLLYSSDKEIKDTFFFFGPGIPISFIKEFPNSHYFVKCKTTAERRRLRLYLRLFSRIRWPFLTSAEIFGEDHLVFSPGLIGKRHYTLIEDAPLILSMYYNSQAYKRETKNNKGIKGVFGRFVYGNTFHFGRGESNQCEKILLSQYDESPNLKNKTIEIISLPTLWNEASVEKRDFILSLFNITSNDLLIMENKSIIILTQPFSIDIKMEEEEQIELYRSIIQKYNQKDILLKTHPRDPINYKEYFPEISIITKPIPMQLIDIMGIKFKKAVTISSTAVLSFPYEIEIDWIGTTCNKTLFAYYGDMPLPDKLSCK